MKKKILFLMSVVLCLSGYSQFRQLPTTTQTPTKVSPVIKPVKIGPKVNIPQASFTNPSFTRPINGINVTYKLKAVALNEQQDFSINNDIPQAGGGTSKKDGYNCVTTIEKVTANSTNFMSVSQTGEGIYPGAVYKYDDFYKANFQNTDLNNWARNPISISSDNALSSTVANPNHNSLSDAAFNLKNQMPNITGGIATSQYTYSDNLTALMVNATAGGAYSGFSAAAGFNFNKADSSIYITYDYRLILYNLTANIPQNGFFADPARDQTQNLIWISNVSYGGRILANVKINASQLKIGANANFQYGDPTKAGFKAAADFVSANKGLQCTINIYTVGLPGSATLSATMSTTLDNLDKQIQNALRSVTPQSARPVMYTLYNMAGNRIAVESATDSYPNTLCIPENVVYTLKSANVKIHTGKGIFDDKVDGSSAVVQLLGQRGRLGYESMNTKINPDANTTFGLRLDHNNVTLDEFKAGGTVEVTLNPATILGVYDAWKIERVTLELNFVSQTGTPYPQGTVIIEMNNAVGNLEKHRNTLSSTFKFTGQGQSGFEANTSYLKQN